VVGSCLLDAVLTVAANLRVRHAPDGFSSGWIINVLALLILTPHLFPRDLSLLIVPCALFLDRSANPRADRRRNRVDRVGGPADVEQCFSRHYSGRAFGSLHMELPTSRFEISAKSAAESLNGIKAPLPQSPSAESVASGAC
jgi:hypothetical protein